MILDELFNMTFCNSTTVLKPENRHWYVFTITSVTIFLLGIFVTLICRLLKGLINRKTSTRENVIQKRWYVQFIDSLADLETARNLPGKLLVVFSFLANIIAFIIYIYYTETLNIEYCRDLHLKGTIWVIELILYIFFLFRFTFDFIIATDKWSFWTYNLYNYIDILTIPIIFIEHIIGTGWIGFRFLRVVYIMKLPQILIFLNVFEAGTTLQLSEMCAKLIALLFSAAGMIHLLENTGDFWPPHNYTNSSSINIFECIYLVVVTLSTVGYGDISCNTYLGRSFSMLVIISGLGLFATYVPALFDFLASHTIYDRAFKTTIGKKHVVVTGHITDKSVSSFIQDFLHPDRQYEGNVNIVFLSPEYPSVLIQSILQKHFTSVFYFIGTVYKLEDCRRVKMETADAVIVLCDKKCENPEAEDASNITRVMSMKKFFREKHVRCIVQLMRKESKAHLQHFQLWNEQEHGDAIVCTDELKLGFMAQSCNSPGFSTLLANLFVMRSMETKHMKDDWKNWYIHGVSCEIYSCTLSDFFVGKSFPDAAIICFEKMNILLIAIEYKTPNGRQFAINPNGDLKLEKDTRAFVIGQDSKSVANAELYCGNCHGKYSKISPDDNILSKCNGHEQHIEQQTKSEQANGTVAISNRKHYKRNNNRTDDTKKQKEVLSVWLQLPPLPETSVDLPKKKATVPKGEHRRALFDQTGTYFWCKPREFKYSIMTLEDAESHNFYGHVVVLVVSSVKSPPIGIRQLIQPLRASNQSEDELKKIVLFGDLEYMRREWLSISTFPDLYVVEGSAHCQVHLSAVNVHLAEMCILIAPCQGSENVEFEKEAMSDKEIIMASLTLRAMSFKTIEDIQAQRKKQKNNGNLVVIEASQSRFKQYWHNAAEFTIRKKCGESIRMITELVYDSNILYMDDDEGSQAQYDSDGIWMSQSYACGTVFTNSVLDFLASATYFKRDILTLVQHLVTGSVNSELDTILSQGRQPDGTKETPHIAAMRNRCRVEQLALADPMFTRLSNVTTFGELFLESLQANGTLCLGLYRLHTRDAVQETSLNRRYVINFPPPNFQLQEADLVFVLLQFENGMDT